MKQVADAHDLSVQYMLILTAVHSKKARTVGSLADEFSLHQANVSTLIKRMETEGLLVRSVKEDDVRVNILSLTEKARKIMRSMYNMMSQKVEDNTAGADMEIIRAGLQEMIKFIEGML